jgi:hypothetical protein
VKVTPVDTVPEYLKALANEHLERQLVLGKGQGYEGLEAEVSFWEFLISGCSLLPFYIEFRKVFVSFQNVKLIIVFIYF